MARDGFRVIDGERSDDDPTYQDDEDALTALAEVIGGPKGKTNPSARAREVASRIMNGDEPPGSD